MRYITKEEYEFFNKEAIEGRANLFIDIDRTFNFTNKDGTLSFKGCIKKEFLK